MEARFSHSQESLRSLIVSRVRRSVILGGGTKKGREVIDHDAKYTDR